MSKYGCCADKACNDKTCMELPAGNTCGDCAIVKRCVAFGVTTPERTSCDWFPRKFRAQPIAPEVMS